MKILALLACLGLLFVVPTVTGATFTKSGPPPISGDFCHGGGGGPKIPTPPCPEGFGT